MVFGQKQTLYVSLLMAGLLLTAPALAASLQVENGTIAYHKSSGYIQIIEGDQVRTDPPIPRLHADVTFNEGDTLSPNQIHSLISSYNRKLQPEQVAALTQTIHLMSDNYKVDPQLIASLVAVESSFRPDAISSSGAIGLGQLKPDTARWLGVSDPFDPHQNIMGVTKYLRYLLDRYNGSVQHALAAYFQGQGTIDRNGINEGAWYYISKVNKVMNRF